MKIINLYLYLILKNSQRNKLKQFVGFKLKKKL